MVIFLHGLWNSTIQDTPTVYCLPVSNTVDLQLLTGWWVWTGALAQGVTLCYGILGRAKKNRFILEDQKTQELKLKDVSSQVSVGYRFSYTSSLFSKNKSYSDFTYKLLKPCTEYYHFMPSSKRVTLSLGRWTTTSHKIDTLICWSSSISDTFSHCKGYRNGWIETLVKTNPRRSDNKGID